MCLEKHAAQQCTLKKLKLSENVICGFTTFHEKGGENRRKLQWINVFKNGSKFQEHFYGNYSVAQEHPL